MTTYDRTGIGYARVRRGDPRIAARVDAALGGARTVLNVGAGTGSYEPTGREVTAVEPSATMVAQRPEGAAPAVLATAEELPFGDASFDAAMAMITVHHWEDLDRGVGEMRRVARERLVVLSFDATSLEGFWLLEYFPQAFEIHDEYMPAVDELAELMGGAAVEAVAIPRRCSDGFFIALWDRPELHLDPDVRRGSTVWHEMDPDAAARGLAALSADLESGRWDARHGHLREDTPELDLGLRLLVAELG